MLKNMILSQTLSKIEPMFKLPDVLKMKIYIPEKARNGIGGGWVFTANLVESLKDKVEFVNNWKDSDILFIPGPTMEERSVLKEAKEKGKKIVFRIDNLVKNSRNRNTGTSRLYDFSQLADEVVYQSEWARDFIQPFTGIDGIVILNGADPSIFNKEGRTIPKEGSPQYLYSKWTSDPTKRWEEAWYQFQMIFYKNPEAHLWIIGRHEFFGINQIEYNFDFFGGAEKRVRYLGAKEERKEVGRVMRSADILLCPYANDACSNTVVEARLSGLEVIYDEEGGGGTKEIMEAPVEHLTLEHMGKRYLEVFNKVI